MTSKSSKALPYLALTIVFFSLLVEVHYNVKVDLETAIPFLIAIGVSGAGLKAVERAANARKQLPGDIEKLIKERIKESEDRLDSTIRNNLSH